MIAEDVLERALHAAADRYDVPPGGADAIRSELARSADPRQVAGDVRRFRPRRPRSWQGWTAVATVAAALVIGLPVALGGSGTPRQQFDASNATSGAGAASSNGSALPGAIQALPRHELQRKAAAGPAFAPAAPPSAPSAGGGTGLVPGRTPDRVVKTGDLALRVPKGQVGASLQRLSDLAGQEHGYVASSDQQTGGPDPSGEVTLRVPVSRFTDTVGRASHLSGARVLSLQTSGQDVTSRYVDLSARLTALERTRSTYLTILGGATTIGQTLEVQDRISQVQTQIEQLQGERKLLADQAALSTLDVTVDQPAAKPVPTAHHAGSGFGHAVHVSVDRFVRGVDAIVSILGPLLLAVILVGLAYLAGRFAHRRFRRHLV